MVRITRMLLRNFSAIKRVTGKDEIEIRRSGDNVLCLLVGANGSGKSTILQELTPFPLEHVGARTSRRIIDGKKGVKELDISCDDNVYQIHIEYGNTTGCFIKKNGIELNPNGNVKTYLDVLEREFGLDSNYVNIGYLSSGITSILDMKSTERVNYVSSWLPKIGMFIDGFKVAQRQANSLKGQINMLNNDIAKLMTDDVDAKKGVLDDECRRLEVEIGGLSTKIAEGSTYRKIIPDVTLEDIKSHRAVWQSNLKILNSERIIVEAGYRDLHEIMTGVPVKERVAALETTHESLAISHGKVCTTIDHLNDEMRAMESELKGLSSSDDAASIISMIDSHATELSTINTTISSMEKSNPHLKSLDGMSSSDMTSFSEFITDIGDFCDRVTSTLPSSVIISYDTLMKYSVDVDDRISTITKAMVDVDVDISNTGNQIYGLKHSTITEALLKLRPKECDRSCGLVDEILRYVNPDAEISLLESKLSDLTRRKNDLVDEKASLERDRSSILSVTDEIVRISRRIMNSTDLLGRFPRETNIFTVTDILTIIPAITSLRSSISDWSAYVSACERRSALEHDLQALDDRKKRLDGDLSIREKFTTLLAKVREYQTERDRISKELDETEVMTDRLNKLTTIKSDLDIRRVEHDKTCDIMESERRSIVKDAQNWYYRSSLGDTLVSLERQLSSRRDEYTSKKGELDELLNRERTVSVLTSNRDALSEKLKTLTIVQDIWSPKTGYPSMVMSEFLDVLLTQTNHDLEGMWGSSMSVEEFRLDGNEFTIPVRRDDTIVRDVSECSDGEKATLGIAISFALIETNLRNRKYNVIRMDECDSTLDTDRRRTFLGVMTERLRQIDCGDCYVITHNDAVYDVPADVIIMRGADISSLNTMNKKIIFQI